MSATDVAQTIQLIIAPVVLITACTLIQNGILGRYASLGERMRLLAGERLELLRFGKSEDALVLERLQEISRQLPLLTRRHRLLQNAVLIIYSAISIFLFNMFAIAVSVVLNSGGVATFALALFLVGTSVLLVGVFFTSLEIQMSHQAICYEVQQIASLGKPW